MAGPIGNDAGVQNQQNIFQRAGAAIRSGILAIAGKLAEFGHAVADFFRGLGQAAMGAQANAHPAGATAPVLPGATFSADEKAQLKQEAGNSDFFRALEGSTDNYVNQQSFLALQDAVLNTPATAAGMKAYGVTLAEAISISMYTSQAYREVNAALRNDTGNAAMEGLAEAFTNGLAKLPSFDGNPVDTPDGVMYQAFRGAKLPEAVGSTYLIGTDVSDPGIMSSTYDAGEAFTGVNYSITLLLKPGSEGKDISMFSDKPTECEVAFPPNVGFQVIGREFDHPHLSAELAQAYHPNFDMTGQPMGTVQLVMQEL